MVFVKFDDEELSLLEPYYISYGMYHEGIIEDNAYPRLKKPSKASFLYFLLRVGVKM
jgi:hypothetical protein